MVDLAPPGGHTEFVEVSDFAQLSEAPLVSVYMATFNHGSYIAEAIEGILHQETDFPIELVIGEDCSTDDTRSIALGYQKRYPELIRVVAGNRNVGAIRNSNRCLALCRGEFIAFCEGDDFWHHPGKLQLQLDAMRANPFITLCHSDFDRLIGNRLQKSVYSQHPPSHLAQGDAAFLPLLRQWSAITATSVYRADVIRDFLVSPFNRFDWPFGDYNKALFASAKGTVLYQPISMATWRKVPGSVGNRGLENNVRLARAGVECREEFLRVFPQPTCVKKDVLENSYTSLMKDAFIVRDFQLHRDCRDRLISLEAPVSNAKYFLQRLIMKTRVPHALFRLAYGAWERTKSRRMLNDANND